MCDLNCRMNSLLADFSYCNRDSISFIIKRQIFVYTAWRKAILKYINYHSPHTILINYIIQCYPIDIIL